MAALSHKTTIHAPQDKVFEALATIEGLRKWYTPTIDSTVGKNHEAVFSFADDEPFRWKFIEVKPGSLVRWECVEGPGSAAGTTVTFRLSSKGNNQTVVECDHEGWPERHASLKTCNTLWGILMGHLKKYAETGQVQPAFRGKKGSREHVA